MSDLISRQAAINLIEGIETERLKGNIGLIYAPAIKGLRALPSSQPEIIRCKDCKYGDTFHEFDEPEMPMKCIGQHYGGTYPDDFCSYAERREE